MMRVRIPLIVGAVCSLCAGAGLVYLWTWLLDAAPSLGAAISFLLLAFAALCFAAFVAALVMALTLPPPVQPKVAPVDETTKLIQ